MRKYAGLMLAASLTACGLLPDHSLDYRDSPVGEPLQLPEGIEMHDERPLYVVPNPEQRLIGRQPGEKRFEVPKPPQLIVLGRSEEEDAEPLPESETVPALLGRDGNGYPIIMLSTHYAWAWEYIDRALQQTDLKVTDRDRDVGIFYVKVPERYQLDRRSAQIKLSHTTNGIQVAALNAAGDALVEKVPGLAMLERIYSELD